MIVFGQIVAFGQKWLFIDRERWLYLGKSDCIPGKWLYSGKVVLFG